VLTTAYPIQERIMRIAVQAGCRLSITREYALLFDPVSIQPPAIGVVGAATPVQRPSGSPAERQRRRPSPLSVAGRPKHSRCRVRKSPKKRIASAPPAKATAGSSATVQTPAATKAPTIARAERTSNAPRLQISRAVGDEATPSAGMTREAAAEREALMAIEEQTVVLQRQIAELSFAMERVQQELHEAQAARDAAENAARLATARGASEAAAAPATPWTALRASIADYWPQFLLVATLIGLISMLVINKRHKY
jgi:hypothetical protein